MFTVVTNTRAFLPSGLTRVHLVFGQGVIQTIMPGDSLLPDYYKVLASEIIDADGAITLPGLIDGHTHPLGAAGESGPATRAPEIPAEQFIKHGITSIVGMLGADDFSRTMASLVARTRALCEAGLSAFCLSGSYRFPPTSLGSSVPWDLFFIPEILGAGEIALSDVRSSVPTTTELRRFVQECLRASSSAGKRGVVLFHIGDEPTGLTPVIELVTNTQLDTSRIIATHINRNERLMAQAPEVADIGVWCDLTAIEFDCAPNGFIPAEEAVARLIASVSGIERKLTVTSDCGTFVGGGHATSPASLLRAFRKNALDHRVGLERAVTIYMANPAQCYGLRHKGAIAVGRDADLIITDDGLNLRDVFARGVRLMKAGIVQPCEEVLRTYGD